MVSASADKAGDHEFPIADSLTNPTTLTWLTGGPPVATLAGTNRRWSEMSNPIFSVLSPRCDHGVTGHLFGATQLPLRECFGNSSRANAMRSAHRGTFSFRPVQVIRTRQSTIVKTCSIDAKQTLCAVQITRLNVEG